MMQTQQIEEHKYAFRTFTMPTGLVLRIKLDEWYFKMFDWLTSSEMGYDGESIIASCYEASLEEPERPAQEAFGIAFAIMMQTFYDDRANLKPLA